MILGKTRLPPFPDSKSCVICPFPGYRDQQQPNVISWDDLTETERHPQEPVLSEPN
jgi:hypothetical protein